MVTLIRLCAGGLTISLSVAKRKLSWTTGSSYLEARISCLERENEYGYSLLDFVLVGDSLLDLLEVPGDDILPTRGYYGCLVHVGPSIEPTVTRA